MIHNMRRFFWFLILGLLFDFYYSNGQSFIPYNIEKAIKSGTRTDYGFPGPEYFQNRARYHIDAEFNPKTGELDGKADIVYFNNSPDTLRKIVIRLYQNIGKKGGIRDESFHADDIHDGVSVTVFQINNYDLLGQSKYRIKQEGTNLTAFLVKPLLPSDSCKIAVSWNFVMPSVHVHRYGKYNMGSYFVGYWYPQVAVYDDIDGWDKMNYTGTHEFYNDFNDFDVSIKVPKNYMVWATGNWKNQEKILSSKVLQQLEKAHCTDEIIQIIGQNDWEEKKIFSKKSPNTFQFMKDNISDFAFAVSNNYLWDATSVVVDSLIQRRVWVSSVYDVDAPNFKNVAAIAKDVIRDFSYNSYGIPFPFPGITIFNGEGGMEYPMMVNNGNMFLRDATVFLTMHEIAHSYFPFLTGINERKYSWLDEGLTTYLPIETESAMNSNYYPIELIVKKYNAESGSETDVPLFVPAYQTRGYTYQFYSYIRPATAFFLFEEYMGRKSFRKAIIEFIRIWKYKHPTPYDFFAVLKKHTNKDMNWFIDAWFFTPGWPDLAIGEVEMDKDSISIEIVKKGSLPVPIILTFEYQDGSYEVVKRSIEVWKENDRYLLNQSLQGSNIKGFHLDYRLVPDKDHTNNHYLINTD